jgi:16S rRNA processing protein RimM
MDNYFKFGKIVATHGTQGQLVIAHSLGKKTALTGLEAVFIEQSANTFLPYFITSSVAKNDHEVFVTLDGIDAKEKAREVLKKELWLPETDFKKFAAAASPISLLGFTVYDKGKPLGEVIEVIEQPQQVVCKIIIDHKEILLPVHGGTLLKMDNKKRILYLELPDGLLDIYLES